MFHFVKCSVKRKLVLMRILDLRNELGFVYHYIPKTNVRNFECISFVLDASSNSVRDPVRDEIWYITTF